MIAIEKDNYKLLKKIKDPKFNIDKLEHYSLSLQLGVHDFQVFIFDTLDRRALILEDYIFTQDSTNHNILDILKHIIDHHHLLSAGFWKSVTIVVKNRKFALVPEKFFEKEAAHSYLRLNHSLSSSDKIYSIHHKDSFVSVFAENKAYSELFKGLYPNTKVRFLHQSSPMINGTLKNGADKFLLHIDRFNMHLSFAKNGTLYYYNQFPVKKMEDYVRYVKLVATDLNINMSLTPVQLYGFLGQNSPQYTFLKEHIPILTFGERPKVMTYGYVFDELADHQYFDVFSLY